MKTQRSKMRVVFILGSIHFCENIFRVSEFIELMKRPIKNSLERKRFLFHLENTLLRATTQNLIQGKILQKKENRYLKIFFHISHNDVYVLNPFSYSDIPISWSSCFDYSSVCLFLGREKIQFRVFRRYTKNL